MSVGGKKGGPQSDINVTPMIDVVMVLLIIFMVVQQGLQKGLDVQVPPVENADEVAQAIDQIVLSIGPNGQYDVNSQVIPAADLQSRLTEIYAERTRKVIFVRGAENITYGDIIFGIDAARAAGIDVVGLVPRT
jgi:biopolymer transport protein ExbD/biopolymer transport protein TolR